MGDFRGITIDPPGSRDLDDAFEVRRNGEGWRVTVAVPRLVDDVLRGSEPDLAARGLGETEYRATTVVREMLGDLTEARSLLPGGDRPAFLFEILVAADLSAEVVSVSRATFRSLARMTYAGATAALKDGGGPVGDILSAAADLAGRLEDARRRSGAIGWRTLAGGATLDEEGRIVDRPAGQAETVVRETMILTNASMAAWAAAAGIPLLYRNHRPNPLARRETILQDIELAAGGAMPLPTFESRFRMLVGRATLGPRPDGHWALNLPAYAWFTSPLRRYADLVNQRQVDAHLHGIALPHAEAEVAEIAAALDELRAARRDARSDALKSMAARVAGRIPAEALPSLDQVGFTGVVKACHDAGRFDDAVVREAAARISRGALTSKDVARLLAGGGDAAKVATDRFVDTPGDAVAVLNHLSQRSGWEVPEPETRESGPPHARTFEAKASGVANGRAKATEWMRGATKKEAAQRAAASLLALSFDLDAPAWPEVASKVPGTEERKPAVPEGNPKGALMELCQKRKWAPPTFETRASGPPHAPTFRCVASVAGTSSEPVEGSTRKQAEAMASAALLPLLA